MTNEYDFIVGILAGICIGLFIYRICIETIEDQKKDKQ